MAADRAARDDSRVSRNYCVTAQLPGVVSVPALEIVVSLEMIENPEPSASRFRI